MWIGHFSQLTLIPASIPNMKNNIPCKHKLKPNWGQGGFKNRHQDPFQDNVLKASFWGRPTCKPAPGPLSRQRLKSLLWGRPTCKPAPGPLSRQHLGSLLWGCPTCKTTPGPLSRQRLKSPLWGRPIFPTGTAWDCQSDSNSTEYVCACPAWNGAGGADQAADSTSHPWVVGTNKADLVEDTQGPRRAR